MVVLGASVPVGLDDPRRIRPTFVASGLAARRPETGPKRIFGAYRAAVAAPMRDAEERA